MLAAAMHWQPPAADKDREHHCGACGLERWLSMPSSGRQRGIVCTAASLLSSPRAFTVQPSVLPLLHAAPFPLEDGQTCFGKRVGPK